MVIFESKLSKVTNLSVHHKASTVPNTGGKNSKWSRGPPEPPGYCRHLNHCPRRPRSPFGTSCWRRWSCNWLPPRYPQKRLWSEINWPRGPPRPSRPRGWHTGPAYRQTDGRIPLSLFLSDLNTALVLRHICASLMAKTGRENVLSIPPWIPQSSSIVVARCIERSVQWLSPVTCVNTQVPDEMFG